MQVSGHHINNTRILQWPNPIWIHFININRSALLLLKCSIFSQNAVWHPAKNKIRNKHFLINWIIPFITSIFHTCPTELKAISCLNFFVLKPWIRITWAICSSNSYCVIWAIDQNQRSQTQDANRKFSHFISCNMLNHSKQELI